MTSEYHPGKYHPSNLRPSGTQSVDRSSHAAKVEPATASKPLTADAIKTLCSWPPEDPHVELVLPLLGLLNTTQLSPQLAASGEIGVLSCDAVPEGEFDGSLLTETVGRLLRSTEAASPVSALPLLAIAATIAGLASRKGLVKFCDHFSVHIERMSLEVLTATVGHELDLSESGVFSVKDLQGPTARRFLAACTYRWFSVVNVSVNGLRTAAALEDMLASCGRIFVPDSGLPSELVDELPRPAPRNLPADQNYTGPEELSDLADMEEGMRRIHAASDGAKDLLELAGIVAASSPTDNRYVDSAKLLSWQEFAYISRLEHEASTELGVVQFAWWSAAHAVAAAEMFGCTDDDIWPAMVSAVEAGLYTQALELWTYLSVVDAPRWRFAEMIVNGLLPTLAVQMCSNHGAQSLKAVLAVHMLLPLHQVDELTARAAIIADISAELGAEGLFEAAAMVALIGGTDPCNVKTFVSKYLDCPTPAEATWAGSVNPASTSHCENDSARRWSDEYHKDMQANKLALLWEVVKSASQSTETLIRYGSAGSSIFTCVCVDVLVELEQEYGLVDVVEAGLHPDE